MQHKKFKENPTKIKGGCQMVTKVAPLISYVDLSQARGHSHQKSCETDGLSDTDRKGPRFSKTFRHFFSFQFQMHIPYKNV